MPASYIATRSLYRSSGALLAAGLVASSSVLIEFSTNARGYGMVCLAFMALIPLAAYALRNWNWAAWLLFAIVAALGFYAIPVMLYPFGGVILWLMLCTAFGDHGAPARSVMLAIVGSICISMLLTAELYSPLLAVSGPMSLVANKWVVASPLPIFLHGLPLSLASTWSEWNRSVPRWLSSIFAVGLVLSLLLHRPCGRFRVPLLVALILWVGPLLLLQRVVPFERVWLFALPLYFITSAAGLAGALDPFLKRYSSGVMILIAVAVSLFVGLRVVSSRSAYLANDCRGLDQVAAYLKTELRPGDSVAVDLPSDVPLYYYFQKEGVAPSFIYAQTSGRKLVVVNDTTGETVQKVLQITRLPGDATRARLLVKYDSASLYEVR